MINKSLLICCKIFAFLFLFFSVNFQLIGQTKLFNNEELNSTANYRVTQDHDGFIWMIGEKGITKYDGTKTRVFTTKDGLPTNDIWNIRITDDNRIWFFSHATAHGYIYKDSVYSFFSEIPITNDTSFFPVGIVQTDSSVSFYDTYAQLFKLIDGKWRIVKRKEGKPQFKLESGYFNYLEFNNDSIFLITKKNNQSVFVCRNPIDETPFFNIFPNNILAFVIENSLITIDLNLGIKRVLNLSEYQLSSTGRIGLSFVNHSFQFTGYNFVSQLDSNFNFVNLQKFEKGDKFNYSLIDKTGNLWMLSFNNGLYFRSASELLNTSFEIGQTEKLKYLNNKIHFILEDKTFGCFDESINQIQMVYKNKLYHELKDYDFCNNKYHLFEHTTTILNEKLEKIGSGHYADIKGVHYVEKYKYLSHLFYSVQADSNLNELHKYNFNIGDVTSFQDTLFISNKTGLYYQGNNEILPLPINFYLPIISIESNTEALFIGTEGNGLYQYKRGKVKRLFKEISFVQDIKIYHDTLIFVATNKGLYSFIYKDSSYTLKYIYNINDGLKTNYTNSVLLVDDNLYIATSKGINRFKYGEKSPSQLQAIYLTKIQWNNQLINDSVLRVYYETDNLLEIDFSTINYSIKNYLKYSYKMSPSQQEFIEIPQGQINLNNIPIGEYQLIIKVENEKSEILTKVISISILPNWYQTMWFQILVFLLFLGLVVFIIYLYFRRISKKAEIKNEQEKQLSNFKLEALRTQMNPHFVFNSLNAIQYYMNQNDLVMSDRYLLKFSRLIRQFFDLSNVTEISINKEAELLTNYLEIEKMRFVNNLDFEVKVDSQLKENSFVIPTMILQPIVENAVNHGIFHKKEPGKVVVSFNKLSEKSYEVVVTDDGIGIEKAKEIKRQSIQGHVSKSTAIFKERIQLLNTANLWGVTYTIDNHTQDSIFPGTEVRLIFTKK